MTSIINNIRVTHFYLWAWDRMMGSFPYWSDEMQRKARETNAPLDAIYLNHETPRQWETFGNVENLQTARRVHDYAVRAFRGACPNEPLPDYMCRHQEALEEAEAVVYGDRK